MKNKEYLSQEQLDWYNKEYCLEAVKADAYALQYVDITVLSNEQAKRLFS